MRIRLRRSLLDMSQSELGEKLGVTFQQVQKYERGANRVGASRLFDLAKVLDVSVGYFFKGLEEALDPELSSDDDILPTFVASKHGPRLMIALSKIEDNEVLLRFLLLVESAAGISHDGEDPD
ncbi:MAG: helix-turn-helix domain-containing protein [Patescibacteria group bacterium UBA2103]